MRVGGSVWELKIDPKRLREEIKNDIEKQRKKRDEHKNFKGEQKTAPELPRSGGGHLPFCHPLRGD